MIFRHTAKFPINSWPGRLRGEVAFIVGNGPSLLENDLKLIDGFFSIGINRAFRVLLPTILIWQDASLYEDCYEDLKFLSCAKLTSDLIDEDKLFNSFRVFPGPFRFTNNPALLYGGGCTAALAVQLACCLGCSSIVLLGIDCKYKNDKTDFYGQNKNHTELTLSNFLAAMEWVSRECPIPVFNCGDAPYWPRISLEKAIKQTQPQKEHHLLRLGKLL